jgi:hypothetical protein
VWGISDDILIDALCHFLEKTEGKTKNQIRITIPAISDWDRRYLELRRLYLWTLPVELPLAFAISVTTENWLAYRTARRHRSLLKDHLP